MARGEGDDRGRDGWMPSLTLWTWIYASSGRWWRTGKPGVLHSMGSQRVKHDWATEQQINLLSILLRWNGFARIQKAVVDQTTSRPPNSDNDLFWFKSGFGKYFGASSWSNCWASHCWLSYKIHFSSHDTIWLRNGSLLLSRIRGHFRWQFFKNFQSAHKAPTYRVFPPFQFASNTKWL